MLAMSTFHTALEDRAVLRLSGADRVDFLQNLVTQDVARPQAGACVMTALLTPQGKLLFDFIIYVEEDGFLLDVDAESAEALLKKLTLYKLRADVKLEMTDLAIHAIWQADGQADGQAKNQEGEQTDLPAKEVSSSFYQDPRHHGLGLRGFFDSTPDTGLPQKPLADWHVNRLKHGVPQGQSEMPPGSIFPLEYGFEAANAIDFQKGCFVGQEVTSRTHRKGSLRKKLRSIEVDGATGNHGDKLLTAAERVGGELVALRDVCGLALIREDALAEPLTLNGAPVRLTL